MIHDNTLRDAAEPLEPRPSKPDAVAALRHCLGPDPRDVVSDADAVTRHLAAAWDYFRGSNGGGMHASKLSSRVEKISWDPPLLQFRIERHGGTVWGSSRAEFQWWVIDLDERTAAWDMHGYRQVRPRAKPLDVKPVAAAIADSVLRRHRGESVASDQLKWYPDGTVRVLVGSIVPDQRTPMQTLRGRRKRFWQALDDILLGAGWTKLPRGAYRPPSA